MRKLIGIVVLLIAGMCITPATGSMIKSTQGNDQVELDFYDCTNLIPQKTTITLPRIEWEQIKLELAEAKSTATTVENGIFSQLQIFKNHRLITPHSEISALSAKINIHFLKLQNRGIIKILPKGDFLNNSIISAMCAINFELSNGTTVVLGLNSFINYIGFDIISFHKGYSPTGIEAKGLISKSTTPGEFVGFCFGFLGYWYGEKTGTGIYSSVTCAGFTVITAWFPIPELP
ncbi:MAG: hypothetical protein KKG04_02390 [Candidatus Thermoplasmatota archaeon]|nr:hypothetical protein [Candidatus Thermoplasmatota archaeon]